MRRQLLVSQSLEPGASSARFVLRTLGNLELLERSAADELEPIRVGAKSLALLAYLACAPTRSVSRERIGELLWAAGDTESALQSIRQARASLKRLSGEELVVLHGTMLVLSDAVATDRDGFRELLARDDLAGAVAMYRGPFCDQFASAGADDFERWADVERASLRARCAEAIARLATRALTDSRTSGAIALAAQLATIAPEDERHWRIRFEALLIKRDWFNLRIAVSDCGTWLAAEGREPSRALRQLLERAARPHADSGEHTPATELTGLHSELVGRETQFGALLGAWKAVGDGRPAAVVVVGASGFGKTRLLRDVRERLLSTSSRVVSVRALPADSELSFALISRLAAALAGLRGAAGLSERSAALLLDLNPALAEHFRSIARTPGPTQPIAYLEALDELLTVLSDEVRLAVIIDDLHWADAESAQMIASIGERQAPRKLLLVMAMRPREVRASRTPHGAAVVHVDALGVTETESLLASIARLPDDAEPRWWAPLHEASGGNPLLILEGLRLSMDGGCLSILNGEWHVMDAGALGKTLASGSAMTSRLSRLDSASRAIALVLAVAGRPLLLASLFADGHFLPAEMGNLIQRLELRDVAVHLPEGWSIAHDALAEALIQSSDAAALGCARMHAGGALRAMGNAAALRSALHLFATTESWDECAEVVRLLARTGSGTWGNAYRRTAEVLASVGVVTARNEIRRRLPVALRYPLRRATVAAAVVLASVTALISARSLLSSTAFEPDSQLVLYATQPGGATIARQLDLDMRRWPPERSTDVDELPRVADWPARGVVHGTLSPSDRASAVERFYRDSGAVDVALSFPDGHEERLTSSVGDDVPANWAPDGSSLLFASSRGGQLGHRAVYVIDMITRHTTRLTSGGSREFSDAAPMWSPDGSRIAFVRRYFSIRPPDLCVIDADGQRERCMELSTRSVGGLSGWVDPYRITAQTDSSGVHRTEIITLADRTVQSPFPRDQVCSISPSGHWAACTGGNDAGLSIAPLAALQSVQHVALRSDPGSLGVVWRTAFRPDHVVDRIRLSSAAATAPIGVGISLKAEVLTRSGERIDNLDLRWSLADTTQGSISSSGVLVARRPGVIGIKVSAGGWRSAEMHITAEGRPSETLAHERWDPGFTSRWRLFGEPLPGLWLEGGRQTFWNRGDGDHFSGAYRRQALFAKDGLWIESETRTPITALQWQNIQYSLEGLDRSKLAAWDHKTGMFPSRGGVQCNLSYPAGEGYAALKQFGGAGDISSRIGYSMDRLAHGEWYRVLLQLLPDGRCGIAVNGAPVSLSRNAAGVPDSVTVVIQGNSVGTRILVGPLSVGRGVRSDIPWHDLDASGH